MIHLYKKTVAIISLSQDCCVPSQIGSVCSLSSPQSINMSLFTQNSLLVYFVTFSPEYRTARLTRRTTKCSLSSHRTNRTRRWSVTPFSVPRGKWLVRRLLYKCFITKRIFKMESGQTKREEAKRHCFAKIKTLEVFLFIQIKYWPTKLLIIILLILI